MAAPDLKKASLSTVNDLTKAAADFAVVAGKWRKVRTDSQKISHEIYQKQVKEGPAGAKKYKPLADKITAQDKKHLGEIEAVIKQWELTSSDARRLLGELPDRIKDLRTLQSKYQLLVDQLVPGLKAALKKEAKEREKLMLEALKKHGMI